MAGRREWDMTSTHSLESAAEWLRKKGDALLVVIVRPDDVALAADPALAPRDTVTLFETRAEEFHALLQRQRSARRQLAQRDEEAACRG